MFEKVFAFIKRQTQSTNVLSIELKKAVYLIMIATSLLLGLYSIFINATEIIERNLNHYTIFSQMSWLTNKQAILYCSVSIMLFTALVVTLLYNLWLKNTKAVVLYSLFTLITFFILLFVESLTYSKIG